MADPDILIKPAHQMALCHTYRHDTAGRQSHINEVAQDARSETTFLRRSCLQKRQAPPPSYAGKFSSSLNTLNMFQIETDSKPEIRMNDLCTL